MVFFKVHDVFRCIEVDDLNTFKYYISQGDCLGLRNHKGQTPLAFASSKGMETYVRMLLDCVNCKCISEFSPLMYAVESRNVECVRMLLRHGANVNGINAFGDSPLHFACVGSNREIIDLLLQHHAYLNISNQVGNTPLMIAVEGGDLEILKRLIREGCSLDCRNRLGWTPLVTACSKGNVDVCRLFIKMGTDPFVVDMNGDTTLMHAVRSRSEELVILLEGCGVRKNMANRVGNTAFHMACQIGEKDIVALMVTENIDIQNNDGQTGLMLASEAGYLEIVKMLISLGANPIIKDKMGHTAEQIASKNRNFSIGMHLKSGYLTPSA